MADYGYYPKQGLGSNPDQIIGEGYIDNLSLDNDFENAEIDYIYSEEYKASLTADSIAFGYGADGEDLPQTEK